MSEYKANMRALETEIRELAKRPVLDHGSGLQALRDELSNEKHALQEARRGTFTVPSSPKKTDDAIFKLWKRRKKRRERTERRSRSWNKRSSSSAAKSAQDDTSRPACASSRCAQTQLKNGPTCAKPRSTDSKKKTRLSSNAYPPFLPLPPLLPPPPIPIPIRQRRRRRKNWCRARAGRRSASKKRSSKTSCAKRRSGC